MFNAKRNLQTTLLNEEFYLKNVSSIQYQLLQCNGNRSKKNHIEMFI